MHGHTRIFPDQNLLSSPTDPDSYETSFNHAVAILLTESWEQSHQRVGDPNIKKPLFVRAEIIPSVQWSHAGICPLVTHM